MHRAVSPDKHVFQWCDARNEVQTISMIEYAIKVNMKESLDIQSVWFARVVHAA